MIHWPESDSHGGVRIQLTVCISSGSYLHSYEKEFHCGAALGQLEQHARPPPTSELICYIKHGGNFEYSTVFKTHTQFCTMISSLRKVGKSNFSKARLEALILAGRSEAIAALLPNVVNTRHLRSPKKPLLGL